MQNETDFHVLVIALTMGAIPEWLRCKRRRARSLWQARIVRNLSTRLYEPLRVHR
jgi:hypothetical protein